MNYLPSFDIEGSFIEHVMPAIRRADIKTCIKQAIDCLASIPKTPFHIASKLDFTNEPAEIAAKFDAWTIEELERGTSFKSTYIETNGFAHNADQWHFHWFAYDYTTDEFDFEYLGYGWNSKEHNCIVLQGMEELQAVYLEQSNWAGEFEFAQSMSDCIFAFKFVELIQRATQSMKHFDRPLVVSTHDGSFELQLKPEHTDSC